MDSVFTDPLVKNDQHKQVKLFIHHQRRFVHEAYLRAFTILSSLTTDIVVVKGDCSFNSFSDNPCAIFYCNQAGRALLRRVFDEMNRKLKLAERFRNQMFEGRCYHDIRKPNGDTLNMEVNYIGWSYNFLSVTKKECYRVINLFCDTLLDALGVYR